MNITFINPTLGGDYSALDIAITTLATCVNETGEHNARILDFTFNRRNWKKKLHLHIKKYNPEFIGFSVNSLYLNYIKEISKEVKKTNKKIKIMYGGYHASIHPKEMINLEYVDYVFVGDAEETLIEFLDSYQKNKEISKIKGLWYYQKKGELVSNQGTFYSSLDKLPYLDWDLWEDLDKYFYFLGMLYQIGTRGCVYNCSFCEAKELRKCVEGQYYRVMSPERYVKELAWDWEKYEQKGLRLMQLFDQIPTMDKDWLRRFTQEYKRRLNPEKNKYSIFSRVSHLDEEKIKMLASSGCNMVRIGIESGDDYIRNSIMNKQLSTEKIKEVTKLLKKYNINMTAYYILGAPAETRRSLKKTIKLAREVNAERSAFFVFKPFTTESVNLIKKIGGKIDVRRTKRADNITFKAVVNYRGLSARMVERYQRKAYLDTFTPRFLRMIKRDKFNYFIKLTKYLYHGLRNKLSLKYLITYFHIYGFDYIYE